MWLLKTLHLDVTPVMFVLVGVTWTLSLLGGWKGDLGYIGMGLKLGRCVCASMPLNKYVRVCLIGGLKYSLHNTLYIILKVLDTFLFAEAFPMCYLDRSSCSYFCTVCLLCYTCLGNYKH